MIKAIHSALVGIFENEAVPGGRLSTLSKVFSGERKLIPGTDYPALSVSFDGIEANPTGHAKSTRVECELKFQVFLYSVESTVEASEQTLEDLLWGSSGGSDIGVIPVLLENLGFNAEGHTCAIAEIQEASIHIGSDAKGNRGFAAAVPITVETWKRLV